MINWKEEDFESFWRNYENAQRWVNIVDQSRLVADNDYGWQQAENDMRALLNRPSLKNVTNAPSDLQATSSDFCADVFCGLMGITYKDYGGAKEKGFAEIIFCCNTTRGMLRKLIEFFVYTSSHNFFLRSSFKRNILDDFFKLSTAHEFIRPGQLMVNSFSDVQNQSMVVCCFLLKINCMNSSYDGSLMKLRCVRTNYCAFLHFTVRLRRSKLFSRKFSILLIRLILSKVR